MKTRKMSEKKISAELNRIYGKHCSGIEVDIMLLPKVFNLGKKSLLAGDPEEVVGKIMRDFINNYVYR